MRKFQFQGLRILKIRSLLVVTDCFLGERNEEIEVFAQALISKHPNSRTYTIDNSINSL